MEEGEKGKLELGSSKPFVSLILFLWPRQQYVAFPGQGIEHTS